MTVPDFRSASGLFATLKSEHNLKASGKHLFDASVYQTDSSTTSFHTMVRNLSRLSSEAKPTAFHHMLATLGEQGRLMRLYTQNVDGIDTSLTPLATSVPLARKGPWPRTIQLHGGLEKMVCSKCNYLSDFQPALFDGPHPPPCTQCVETDKVRTDHAGKRSHGIGRLRPRIVLYNEHNPDDEAIGTAVSSDLRARPDAVIVVGTSMKIPGVRRIVREMCGVVRSRRDGMAVWVNHDPPPPGKEFEECWDLIVKGSSDDVAAHAKMRHWDDNSIDIKECTESEAERAVQESEVHVVIECPRVQKSTFMPTPATSPGPKPNQPLMKPNFSKLRHVEISGKPSKPLAGNNTKALKPKAAQKARSNKPIPKAFSSKALALTNNMRIDSTYKITKHIQAPTIPTKVLDRESPFSSSADELSPPKIPLLPLATRMEDSIPVTMKQHFPNPIKRSITPEDLELRGPTAVVIPAYNVIERRRGSDIISPTGNPPSGMSRLLN